MRFTGRSQVVTLLALMSLVLGALVYLVDRPADQAIFISEIFSLYHLTPSLFGPVGQSLPTFVHVLAFILLTGILVGGGRQINFAICLSWFVLEIAFEVGQHAAVAMWLENTIFHQPEPMPLLDLFERYFRNGTFDPIDLLSIALGTLVAYLLLCYQRGRSEKSEH